MSISRYELSTGEAGGRDSVLSTRGNRYSEHVLIQQGAPMECRSQYCSGDAFQCGSSGTNSNLEDGVTVSHLTRKR